MSDLDHPHGLLGVMPALDDVGLPRNRSRGHPLLRPAVARLLAMAAVLVGVLVALPTVMVVAVALARDGGLLRWSVENPPVWDLDGFWASWARTLGWAVAVPAGVTAVGLLLAWPLRRAPSRLLDAILVAPVAVPLVVTGVTFRLIFHPDPHRGPATYLFGGLVGEGGWLGPRMVSWALVLAFVWVWLGLVTVVLRTAMDRVPSAVEDAARMTGLRGAELFRTVYWRPIVSRVATLLFLLMAVMSARTLDLMLVTVPESASADARVLSVMHWQISEGVTTGQSAALGSLWLVLAAVVLMVVVLVPSRWALVQLPRPARRADGRLRSTPQAVISRAPSFAALVPVWLAPLLVLGLTALHTPADAAVSGWWSRPLSVDSWGDLDTVRFWSSFRLTAVLTIVVGVVAVAVAVLAAAALAHVPARAARAIVVAMAAMAVVPLQVIAGPMNDLLAAIDRVTPFGLADGVRLALVHVALAVPLCVVVLYPAGSRPFDILAKVRWQGDQRPGGWRRGLGATSLECWRALRTVGRDEPAVVAAAVFVVLQVWNDFVVGLFISGRSAVPLGLLLFGQTRQFVANSGPLAAGSVVMLAVPLVLLALTHRKVTEGLVGSVQAESSPSGLPPHGAQAAP